MRYSQIPKEEINQLAQDVFQNAVSHGWHDEKQPVEHWLCLVISELMEAVEADRKDRHANLESFNNAASVFPWDRRFEAYVKDTFEDEIADATIRLLDLSGTYNFQLDPFDYDEADQELSIPDAEFTIIAYVITAELTPFVETFSEEVWSSHLDFLHFITNDVICLLFMVAEKYSFDLMEHVQLKMRYNASRPFKHGGKKY